MSQQINLYGPAFRKEKKPFTALAMVQALLLVLVALMVLYVYARFQVTSPCRLAVNINASFSFWLPGNASRLPCSCTCSIAALMRKASWSSAAHGGSPSDLRRNVCQKPMQNPSRCIAPRAILIAPGRFQQCQW